MNFWWICTVKCIAAARSTLTLRYFLHLFHQCFNYYEIMKISWHYDIMVTFFGAFCYPTASNSFHLWCLDGRPGKGRDGWKKLVQAISLKPWGVRCWYLVGTLIGGVGVQHQGVILIWPCHSDLSLKILSGLSLWNCKPTYLHWNCELTYLHTVQIKIH